MKPWTAPGFGNLAASALVGAIIAATLFQTVLRDFELFGADLRLSKQASAVNPRNDMVIVAIDDASLANSPFQSPVDRRLLASVVERLDSLGARTIALDIVLDSPSFPEHDARLTAALGDAHAKIILGTDEGARTGEGSCGDGLSRENADERPADAASPSVLPAFSAHAQLADIRVICLDGDGVVRRVSKAFGETPSMAESVAASLGRPVRADGRPIVFELADGNAPPISVYPAANLDVIPKDWIEGRAVLVGVVTPYSGDWFETPLRFSGAQVPVEPKDKMPKGELPGVMIHALSAATLADDRRGAGLSWIAGVVLAVAGAICGAGLGASSAAWWLRAVGGLTAIAGVTAVAIFLGPGAGLFLPLTPFPLGLGIAGGLVAAAEAQRFLAQRRMIRQAFERYLAPSVVSELVRDPSLVALGAAEREISVLFTDLEGFTRFVDGNPPTQVTEILNGYLDAIIAEVIAHGGAVDKIVGDAVHALFSAPLHDADHKAHACACALAIDRASEAYRAATKEKFGIQIGVTRIAVHSGIAMVGNFGGTGRLDYTAHGSTINATARLESANKVFGTRICISEASRVDIPGGAWRPIADVRLRGIEAPMRVYELVPAASLPAADADAFAKAFAALSKDPAEARRLFDAFAARRAGDPLTAFQLGRIESGHPTAVLDV